ncbi:MAG: M20/M25/M40 family metallo-hydrolase [Pyrinomonadaceae bacterium]|nr:M20/M25/M40 family metallo-hydrolase [Pyrinomonadaceae bacterium]
MITIALLSVLILTPTASTQSTASDEQRIIAYVDAHADEAVSLLERTVNIESATLNQAGVRQVGKVFGSELESLGFNSRWIEMPKEMKRAGHLFAERTGTRGKRLLLIGHLDTVLQGKRFERRGTRASGAGSVDMKGGDVVIIYALKALQSIGALDGTRIIVAMTGDEEYPGLPLSISRRDLVEAAKRSDAALAFEAAAGDTATVARRGSSSWRLEVTAQTGHSSGIFTEGAGSGAVFEASRILNSFYQELKGEQYLTFNPGVIVGGLDVTYDRAEKRGTASGKLNVIAKTVVVEGDLRFISEEQKMRARSRMQEIVARNLPGAKAKISFEDSYPAMSPTPGNYELLRILDEASRASGLGQVTAYDPGRRGAGDVSFVAPYVSGLDGLGARGGGSHEPEEFVELDTLPLLIKRAALLIYRLTR